MNPSERVEAYREALRALWAAQTNPQANARVREAEGVLTDEDWKWVRGEYRAGEHHPDLPGDC